MISRLKERPAIVGLVGIATCVLLLVGSMQIGNLPFDRGTTVQADFVDASGLSTGDPVEVAGVRVGDVEDITIEGDHVRVSFTIDPVVKLGGSTAAAVRVGSLLGSKYLEVTPAGAGTLDGVIPTGRTDPAYDVVAAFGDLTKTVDAIDSKQLASALDAVSDTFEGSGPDVRAAVKGLSRLSRTVASRDTEIRRLLDHSATLTSSLADSRDDIGTLVHDASLLLREVDKRREAIDGVVEHSAQLATQLRGLVKDNQATIGPALDDLDTVVTLLQKKQKNLALTVHRLAVFARVFNNTIGSGPWFDSYLGNIPDSVKLEEAP